jgi:hypothetical protein
VYEIRVAKTTPRKVYSDADEGIRKHKEIEDYLKGDAPLSNIILRKLVDRTLAGLNSEHFKYEHKLAITKDRQPCEWDDPSCYHRGIIDVLHVDPQDPLARVFDWKNGKINEYSEQLKANSICVMAHYPHVTTVHTEYVWMKFGKTTPAKNFRDFSGKSWEKFVRRVDRMEVAVTENQWPKKPSGLCKKHCPCITCEHNGGFTNV